MCSESHVVQPVDFYTKRSLPSGFASAMLLPVAAALKQHECVQLLWRKFYAQTGNKLHSTKTIVQQRNLQMFEPNVFMFHVRFLQFN